MTPFCEVRDEQGRQCVYGKGHMIEKHNFGGAVMTTDSFTPALAGREVARLRQPFPAHGLMEVTNGLAEMYGGPLWVHASEDGQWLVVERKEAP